jgi:ATP-binding cassette subfamily B protein
MLKLFKYLKSSILSIIVIILLLVTQAICDLKLPEYTSKIVNVGIQQNGIESAAATVITAEKYDNIELFLSDDEKEYLDSYYDLLTTEDYNDYKDEYPILETENLYKLNTKDEDVKEKISDILSLPLLMDYMITSGKAA